METFSIQVLIQIPGYQCFKSLQENPRTYLKSLPMKLRILSAFALLFNLVGTKAHDYDQIPLEYVRFPQPVYRSISGEGKC